MLRWLQNTEYKVGATVANSYMNDEERGDGGVPYRWVEFSFAGNVAVAFELADGLTLPKGVVPVIERVRALMAAGAFGPDVVRVRIPQPAAENLCDSEPAEPPACTAWWSVERADGSEQAFDLEGGCLVEG